MKNQSIDGTEDDMKSSKDSVPKFHIVGLGASAGGLEALEAFFNATPSDLGAAFVVIQHLSPDFKSHMQDLLGRRTAMDVIRVENGIVVKPNCVYLIPPRAEMIFSDGKLLLTVQSEERSLSHPIDQFFRSLANDAGPMAVAIVLSGTGSDGSRGIVDVHDAGGLVMAQDLTSAKFDGMPRNAFATGVVAQELPPDLLAQSLVRYVKDGLTPQAMGEQTDDKILSEGTDRIIELLNQHHNLNFSSYKESTVGRRIQRRVDLLGLDSINDYVAQLELDRNALNDLYKDLLIGVTKFFRDPSSFEALENDVIPKMLDKLDNNTPIRVWVAGCASGEEAYSIAILLDEAITERKRQNEIKIFATDAHPGSLQTAAKGTYSEEALLELSKARIDRYFRKNKNGYDVSRTLRKHVVFAPHNLLQDAPFTQMDLVSCRNLLIYLTPPAQKKALSMLHFALKSSGILFLGPSETPGELTDEFKTLNKKWRIYKKVRDIRLPIETRMPVTTRVDQPLIQANFQRAPLPSSRVDNNLLGTYDRLLDRKMPPSFLINQRFEILHTFGGAERFLKVKSGRPSLNLLELVNDALKIALNGALQHALKKQGLVQYTGLQLRTDKGLEDLRLTVDLIAGEGSNVANILVEIESEHLSETTTESGMQIDIGEFGKQRVASLESELRYSQENLQATVEEMETTNEELQATNEELVASNEELQSTNEELHSVNEELYTVNAENQRRMDELARANEDMDNLLATTRVGVIFLDTDLMIRRFTPEIARLFHLVGHDIGRSIEGFAHNLHYDALIDDLKKTISERREIEVRIFDRNKIPYILRMLPYHSGNDVIGVVLTLINISTLQSAQTDLEKFKFMTESATDCMALTNSKGTFQYVNPAFSEALGYTNEELLELTIMQVSSLINKRDYSTLFESAQTERLPPFETEIVRKDKSKFPVEMSVATVEINEDKFLFANMRDITGRFETEREMRLNQLAVNSTKNGIIITDPTADDNPIVFANPGFLKKTGYSLEEVLGRNCRFLQGPETDPDTVAIVRDAIQNGDSCRVTIRNYRKDGSLFWNDLQIAPLHDHQGRLINFVGIQSDVTMQRQYQMELEKANMKVKKALDKVSISEKMATQANVAKSQFLANMSHELRTPMTAIIGFADILKAELKDAGHRDRVETIKRNGEYLLALLNDILDLSKIEAGKLEIASESVDIRSVMEDVKSLMYVRSTEEGVPLTFHWNSKVPAEITADQIRIRQILVNLISNALKFTDKGQVKVDTELYSNDEHPRLDIRVKDTGIGMTDDEQSRLFEPFSQADAQTSRRFGGTGLGLNISKRLAEGMGAWISVKSKKGVGSTFTLSLPVSDDQLASLVSPEKNVHTKESPQPELPEIEAKVLLVDDRRDVWRIGKYFLEKCGASVTIAEDGRQAVDAAEYARDKGEPFDLILMDMQMPVMTGREAVKELRRREFSTPIVAITADAMDGERENCLKIGCNDYFPKPIDGPELTRRCAQLLNTK
jgi:two-component system, chemotaxis family, CheB/CheR fusion protein